MIVIVLGGIGFYRWDSGVNRGLRFGYWGEFNRRREALASIPGVTITGSAHNLDVSLEEFSFDVKTNGRSVKLFFGETDRVRTLSRTEAVRHLERLIHEESERTSKVAR